MQLLLGQQVYFPLLSKWAQHGLGESQSQEKMFFCGVGIWVQVPAL